MNPSRDVKAGDTLTVAVDRLAQGGAGVARHHGQVILVEGGLPGDRVRAELTAVRRGHLEARVVERLGDSPWRVEPPCAYAAQCGGCAWMALDPVRQREARVALVRDALQRVAGLEPPADIPVIEGEGDRPGLGYRARIEVALGPPGPGGARRVGFRAAGSRTVVEVARCTVAAPPLNGILDALRRAAADGRLAPPLSEVELAVGDDPGHVVATARLAAALPSREVARIADRLAAALPSLGGLRVESPPARRGVPGEAVERGAPSLQVTVPGPEAPLVLEVPAGGFMQGHPAVNARLVSAVVDALSPETGRRLLDLYCGAGNFALPLAAAGAEVLGLEADGRAVAAARRSASRLGLARARFRQVDVAEGLAAVRAGAGPGPAGVVLDPPRAGVGAAVVSQLLALAPGAIAYVSCDPATLARDLAKLVRGGYRLGGVTVFDMFPQTPHVETLAVLALGP
jgi:23S rRNA (uracil1939-C5)-methyltransferase